MVSCPHFNDGKAKPKSKEKLRYVEVLGGTVVHLVVGDTYQALCGKVGELFIDKPVKANLCKRCVASAKKQGLL